MRVSLFITCLADQFYAEAGAAAVRLLRALGVEVDFPKAQTCCGQPAYNAGHLREAERVAQHALEVFRESAYVVLPSGSCTGMVHRYPELFRGHPAYSEAMALKGKTFELSQFLVRVLGVTRLGEGLKGVRIAYHHGCHALRELGVREEPLLLLRNAGAELVFWEAAEECCGFGGLFSVKLPEVSLSMADRKVDTLEAEVLTSTDAGCLLHLAGRLEHRGKRIRVAPLATLLWEAYAAEGLPKGNGAAS